MKIVFFGTTSFSVAVLRCLLDNEMDVVAIISKPDKPQGRSQQIKPLPVKQFIIDNKITIPFFQPEKISAQDWEQKLQAFHPDLFIVVAFGEIIKKNILDIPKSCSINIHTSLLPKYRGAAPIHRAIMNGEKETGVTIMEMVPALDSGDILHVKKISISDDMDVGDVEAELMDAACRAIIEVIQLFKKNNIKKIPQKDSEATYAHKVTPHDCKIDFNANSKKICDMIRGTNPYPGAWCEVKIQGQVKRLKIRKAKVQPHYKGKPGSILKYEKDLFIVATGDSAIELLRLQLEGKKMLNTKDFILGSLKPEFL